MIAAWEGPGQHWCELVDGTLIDRFGTIVGAALNAKLSAALGNFTHEADMFWRSDWTYLATPGVQRIEAIKADVKGLALPRDVINKIYYANARRVFKLPAGGTH